MLASKLFKGIEEKIPICLALDKDKIGFLGPGSSDKINVENVDVVLDISPEYDISSADLVISHHPPVFEPEFPMYIIHSNWDVVKGGANDALAERLNLKVIDVFDKETGIGRICSASTDLKSFTRLILNSLPTSYINYVESNHQKIEKIAIVSGFGLNNSDYIDLAYENGVNLFLSGDLIHRNAWMARKLGLNVIDATHHATEFPGLLKLSELISNMGVKTNLIDYGVPWNNIIVK